MCNYFAPQLGLTVPDFHQKWLTAFKDESLLNPEKCTHYKTNHIKKANPNWVLKFVGFEHLAEEDYTKESTKGSKIKTILPPKPLSKDRVEESSEEDKVGFTL